MADNGTGMALGAVALLGLAAAVTRQGSRNAAPVALGYHCSRHELRGALSGHIGEGLASRFSELFDALPYDTFDDLQRRAEGVGLGDLRWDRPDEPEDLIEDWGAQVAELLWSMGLRWVWVAERPLSDAGAGRRSSFGDYCYRVRIDPQAVVGWFEDHAVAGGEGAAFAVIYDAHRGEPVLDELEDPSEAPFIDFPDHLS